MDNQSKKQIGEWIESGKAVLGLELGSTRIKAVLIDDMHRPIATGSFEWENRLQDGVWTYAIEDAIRGVQSCYASLAADVCNTYGVTLRKLSAIGISGMMHGYLAFDDKDRQLAEFRTWRNTMTGEAAGELTECFSFNIPQRWSIAHLYQAILKKEEHVREVAFFTTLAGYIHWRLTGQKVLGVGEASGMFPISPETGDYDDAMLRKFGALEAVRKTDWKDPDWKLEKVLPRVLKAGENGGMLTAEGAALLDTQGHLEAGIPMCPPEGDAGTGMAATNAVGVGTGNVSAGTSVFAMVVLKEALKKVHEELDIVTTPSGEAVAMVHCNNCTTDLNAWVNLIGEALESFGVKADRNELYGTLYRKALEGEKDCGGLLSYNFYSGEHIAGVNAGRPLFVRTPEASFTLANFMRNHLYSSLGTLKIGLDILIKEEGVKVDMLYGHGGLFKTKGVAQSILAAAAGASVAVMETAGEGGPWGMALLAAYMVNKEEGETLERYLADKVFARAEAVVMEADAEDVAGFEAYMEVFRKALEVEQCAVKMIN